MTRGCTEAWEASPDRAHWSDLFRLAPHSVVEFVDQWDIFDEGFIVPEGAVCEVTHFVLGDDPAIWLKPLAGQRVGEGVETWNGLIQLRPYITDQGFKDFAEADEFNPAPVRIGSSG